MPDTKHCAECEAPLPAYWPKGLCAQCALDGALDMTNARSQVLQAETLVIAPADLKPPGSSPESSPLGSFGDYDLLDEIARGGMGVVYKARQRNLGRIVAVKMILAGPLAGKDFVRRFRTESAAAAILQHPNIVAIHDVGVHEGRHYFSMDYVEGQNLAQLVGQQPLPPAKAARYVELIAEAIHYAHERGILHRDLKPSNVLIDASDQPRVTDFGLAKKLDTESSLTISGQVLGSPNFMPPEQAGVKRGKVGRPSDVYALGGILYYLLTARAPFQAESLEGIITQVLNAEPVSPRLLNPAIPKDLETITLKCLEKEPSRRYQTAQELADELNRFLRHEPIHARPLTPPEKLWRWGRRKPVLALLILLLHLVGAAGLIGIVSQWRRAEHNAKSERQERERAETQRNVAVEQRKLADMQLALQAWEEGDLQRANELIDASRPAPGQAPGFEWRYLRKLCQDQSHETFGDPNHQYRSAQFFDRDLLLLNDGKALTLQALSRRKNQLLLEDQDGIWTPAFCSGNTNLLTTVTDDGRIKVWDLAARRVRVEFEGPPRSPTTTAAGENDTITFSRDGRWLASAISDKSVKLWDVEARNSKPARTIHRYASWACGVFSPGGRHLFSGGSDSMIRTWDVATGAEAGAPLEGHTSWVYALAMSPDGLRLASGGADSTVIVWDVITRKLVTTLFGHIAMVRVLAFSPDGKILASGGRDQTIRLWDMKTGQQISLLRGHGASVNWLSFSPDGQWLVSRSPDGLVKLWQATPGQERNALTRDRSSLEVALSPDGRRLASVGASTNFAVDLWDLSTRSRTLFSGHSNAVMCVAFSPNGGILATGSHDQTVRLWNVSDHKAVAMLTNGFPVGSLAFSPDGRTLIVGGSKHHFLVGDRGGLQFWDVPSRQATGTIPGDAADIVELALSASGSLLATGHKDGAVSLLDAQTRRLLHRFGSQFGSSVISLAFSPTEPLLAGSDWGGNIVLYNTTTMEVVPPPLRAHTGRVTSLAFSPDGRTLASAGEGGGLKLWHVATRQVTLTLKGHVGAVKGIAFSRDGTFMASCGLDGTVRLWPAATLEEAGAATKTKKKNQ